MPGGSRLAVVGTCTPDCYTACPDFCTLPQRTWPVRTFWDVGRVLFEGLWESWEVKGVGMVSEPSL